MASGPAATVAGGVANVASENDATVSGGFLNVAGPGPIPAGSISGGAAPVICGGAQNSATGIAATVTGGEHNTALGDFSVVGGGNGVSANGADTWHAAEAPGFPTGTEY